MSDSYFTILQEAKGIYREKGSRFLSFAFPVNDEQEALAHVESLKKAYHDARHHCYAYLLGRDQYSRVNDAGEPRHTAGDPILNQIRSRGLNDVIVVVVRYFGGTKLGKSGLINAYKLAAENVLNEVLPVEKILYGRLVVRLDYTGLNEIMRLIDQNGLQVTEQNYDDDIRLVVRVRESAMEQVRKMLNTLPGITEITSLTG